MWLLNAMCGFCFLYDESLNAAGLEARCTASIAYMRVRGPDGSGVFMSRNAALGHARLSIVGLSDSDQPMKSPDGRYILSFNGEIYNFRLLREELARRWSFVTTGDTEVLLAGLVLDGEQFLTRLEGMWAFALWDSLEMKLLMSRDRMGKKPLFYYFDDEVFGAASEIPALNQLIQCHWQEDLDTSADYFRYGYPLPGRTFFKNVHEVPPAHTLRWTKGTEPEVTAHWTPEISLYQGSRREAISTLQDLLGQAVERRLVADVKVGTFLSGGIDSSVVTALASRSLGAELESFSIGFSESSHDESKYSKIVAEFLGVQQFTKVISEFHYEDFSKVLLERVGQPFHDSSIVPTSAVSELASSRVKVALSGDGADELFGGYERYRARKILNIYAHAPTWGRKALKTLMQRMPEPDSHHSRSILKKLHLFMNVVDRRDSEDPYVAPCFFTQSQYTELFPGLVCRGYSANPPWNEDFVLSDVKHMMLADTFVYLPQDILTKVDRASMHHSLEVRSPFLDTDVVNFALSIPIEWTHGWYSSKKMIKAAFPGLLPKDIWQRRKQGFAVPIAQWFKGGLGDQLEIMLEVAQTDVINRGSVKGLLDKHRSGQFDFGYRLWLIYVYLFWKQKCPFLKV